MPGSRSTNSALSRLKSRAALAAIAGLLISVVSACQSATPKSLLPADVKTNPAAHGGNAVAFQLSDLPGAVRLLGAQLHYKVENRDCVPMDYGLAVGGVRLPPQYALAASFWLAPDGALVVETPDDALIDEDYFGLGVCHWELESVSLAFASRSGARFVATLNTSEIRKMRGGDVEVMQYLASDYASPGKPDPAIFGERPGYYPADKPVFALTASYRNINDGPSGPIE